jgi:single-stranded-DNA-specific exonuclease
VESRDFPEGIVGLIAGKLQEEFYKPAIAIHLGAEAHRGSARSIPEFNIVRALDECKELLIRHGGHSAAAGFGVAPDKLMALKERLREIAFRELGDEQLLPTLHIDADVGISDMNFDALRAIEWLAPFGYGNRTPLFVAHNVLVKHYKVVGNNHLKVIVSDGRAVWDGIAFRRADWANELRPLPRRVDLVFTLSADEWQGQRRLQLDIKDMRVQN